MKISEAFEAFVIDELESEKRAQSTIESYQGTCNSLLRGIGADIDIALFSYLHVIRWKRYMRECDNSTAYMAFQLRELRAVLTYLKKHGFGTLDPSEITIPTFEYRKSDWLTLEEVGRFLRAITNPRDKALFSCMFSSGARISELLGLKIGAIVDGKAKIKGKGRNGGKEGILKFDENALRVLQGYLDSRTDDSEYLFNYNQKGDLKSFRSARKTCIYRSHRYARLAGIQKRVSTHVLRHSFGTNLELNGADIHTIAGQMRHSKLETTRIYMHGHEQLESANYKKFHSLTPIH